MAALRDNGGELMRAIRVKTEALRANEDPDLALTFRETYSIRTNGGIMLKRDHRFADDPIGQWRKGKWKRAKKIKAPAWRKLDRRLWLARRREILIAHGFEITAEADRITMEACDRRCELKQDQRRGSW